jgi:transcriptional regulator with XRE-family HTH domain
VGRSLGQTQGPDGPTSGNLRLRLERLARHWEQDDVAAALQELAALLGEAAPGVDGNLVSKWERGVRTPGPYYTPRLCLLFQLPPEGLGFVPGPRLSSECRTLSNALERALAQKVGFVRRREFLQHLLWGGAALASWSALDAERMVAAASGHVDRRLVDDLHAVADDYARRMHTEAPRDLLPQVERHLTYVRSLLRSSQPSLEGGRLHLIAGTMAAVAGRLSFSLGNAGDAHAHYVAAEGHAREAGEGPLRAYVLGLRRQLHSDLWQGWRGTGSSKPLRLLDEAHAAAGTGSSPWLRTWLLACRAEEHANLGDAQAAHRDLEDADHLLGTATSADYGFFAHWHNSPVARLAAFRGNCAQMLGRTEEATATMEDALVALDPSLVSIRSSELVDLAMAYAKEKEVERASGLLAESLNMCSKDGLVVQVQRVIGVRKHLSRWNDAPTVRDLDERLQQVTWAPV